MAKRVLTFHLYKLQFRDEATLFPSSEGIDDIAAFVHGVVRWSMQQKLKTPRRWVVAELELDRSFESTMFFGQLVRLKTTRAIHFEEEDLSLGTEVIEDADTMAFVLDGRYEYFLLQTSPHIEDETALRQFRSFFDKADPRVRKSRIICFEPVNPNEKAIERLKRHKIRKFTATVTTPNGEINKAFEKLLRPVSENTRADEVSLTWESQKGLLNVAEGSAIDEALTWAAEYGSWKAVPYEKGANPIVSEEAPLQTKIPATTPSGIIKTARAFFDSVRIRLGGQKA